MSVVDTTTKELSAYNSKITNRSFAAPKFSFFDDISNCFSKYATFKGRASRSEYWYWTLFTLLIHIFFNMTSLDSSSNDVSAILGLMILATFLPGIAVVCRRLHDIGKSGWWQLIVFIPLIGAIILLIWFCTPGKDEQTVYDT